MVRKRKICPSLTAATAASRPVSPVSRMRVVSGYSCLTCFEQGGTVHPRHAHVRDDDRGSAAFLEHAQSALPAVGCQHLIVAAQLHGQAVDDAGFIVDTENAGQVFAVHDCAVGIQVNCGGLGLALAERAAALLANRRARSSSPDKRHRLRIRPRRSAAHGRAGSSRAWDTARRAEQVISMRSDGCGCVMQGHGLDDRVGQAPEAEQIGSHLSVGRPDLLAARISRAGGPARGDISIACASSRGHSWISTQ